MAMILTLLVGCDGEAYKEWSEEREAQKESERASAERNAKLSKGPNGDVPWQYLNDGDLQYWAYDGIMTLQDEDYFPDRNSDPVW